MKDQLINPINTAIRIGLVGLAFFIPLFFIPVTSEFYQFNKQVLLLAVTSILLILWGVKMGLEGKMRIVRTPLDLPLLLLALAFILATIFSVDRYISIAGFYPRFHGSLVSVLGYVALYFIAVSNLDKKWREFTIWGLVASGTVAAVFGIMNYFGMHPLFGTYAESRTWSPVGNIASLNLFLAMAIPLAIGSLLTVKNRSLQPLFLVAAVIMVAPIFLFKLVGPIIALALGLGLALVFFPKLKVARDSKTYLGIFGIAAAVILVIAMIPALQNTFLKPLIAKDASVNVTADKSLPLGSAWRISTKAVGERPFFGVGPGTFSYSFTTLKGPELNSDDYWNIRFDLSGNEYLTILSTVGIVGIIAFVLILLSFSRSLLAFNYSSRSVGENPMPVFLLASFVVFASGIFFQDTTTTTWVVFVLVIATAFAYLKDLGVKNVEEVDVKMVALTAGGLQFAPANDRNRDSSLGTGFTILGVLAFLVLLYFGLPSYQAETLYQKALVASTENKANETRDHLLAAISKNPNRDTYRRSLIVLDRLIATNLSQKENKTDEDNRNIAGLVSEAITQGNRITGYVGNGLNNFSIRRDPGASPLNVANWEALSGVLASLQLEGTNKTANANNAINVASRAVQLDPRNPVLLETLGNVLLNNNYLDEAIQSYRQAISARPAYVSARYNLANALKQKGGNEAEVAGHLETVLNLLPEDSGDRERIQNELEEAKNEAETATPSANPN